MHNIVIEDPARRREPGTAAGRGVERDDGGKRERADRHQQRARVLAVLDALREGADLARRALGARLLAD
ncbi:MAG TPA: hypothetical protein VNV39_16675 [Stellaceae bacterium]|nr:hypothetical protein [Stellaceae bacterium]